MSSTRCLLRPATARQLYRSAFRPAAAPAMFARRRPMSSAGDQKPPELGVGEMEGAKFKIEPLRRTGEDDATTRARLLCKHSPWASLGVVPLLSWDTHTHVL